LGIVQSLIGRGRTLEVVVTGKPIDARRAQSIGLVGSIVSTAQLESTVNALAVQAAALPADAVAASKRLLSPGSAWSDDAASAAFAECLQTDTARRSIARFRSAK
jgi:enoyl-CoA hydratase/carnithine racemase